MQVTTMTVPVEVVHAHTSDGLRRSGTPSVRQRMQPQPRVLRTKSQPGPPQWQPRARLTPAQASPGNMRSHRMSLDQMHAAAPAAAVAPSSGYPISPAPARCPRERPPFCAMCLVQLLVVGIMLAAAAHVGSVEDVRGTSPLSVTKLRRLRADLDVPSGVAVLDSRSELMHREQCQFNATFPRLPVKAKHYLRALVGRVEGFASCAVVGSAGSLLDDAYGAEIDGHDLVMRFNGAPTAGFERHVGRKTTLAVVNAEAVERSLLAGAAADAAAAAEHAAAGEGRRSRGRRSLLRADSTRGAGDARNSTEDAPAGCPGGHVFAHVPSREALGSALHRRCHRPAGGVFPIPRAIQERALEVLTPSGYQFSSTSAGLLLASLMCPNGVNLYGFTRLSDAVQPTSTAVRRGARYNGRSRGPPASRARAATVQSVGNGRFFHYFDKDTPSVGMDHIPGFARLLDLLVRREAGGCVNMRGPGESRPSDPVEAAATGARADAGVAAAADVTAADTSPAEAVSEGAPALQTPAHTGEQGEQSTAPCPGCDLEHILADAQGHNWDPLSLHSDRAHYWRIAQLVCALLIAIGGLGFTLFNCTHMMHSMLKYAVD
mmetsp:Transcript_29256/g.85785  ORF Transcript_29256/g.85785 Transcript_29256/m.85785 type:complete len:603 (+) Transcript_29256:154-1962(+)